MLVSVMLKSGTGEAEWGEGQPVGRQLPCFGAGRLQARGTAPWQASHSPGLTLPLASPSPQRAGRHGLVELPGAPGLDERGHFSRYLVLCAAAHESR